MIRQHKINHQHLLENLQRLAVPLGLLALLVLNFGLLIPWLGFYWDDWPVILTGELQGASGFWEFYQYDRPFSAWTYVVTMPLLGSRPFNWQVFTLLLRWGTCLAMWWTLITVWPNHRREATWTAVLFAIYPVFTQQAISVAYSQHWICYLLFFLSLGLMAQSVRRPRLFWPLTASAAVASLVQLLTMEYFAGLELLRPLLLWLLLSGAEGASNPRARLLHTIRLWLPYLVTLLGFVIWRLFFLQFPGQDANPPILLQKMLTDPLAGGLRFLEIAVQDTLHLLVNAWAGILSPANVQLSDRSTALAWVFALLVGAAAVFALRRLPAAADCPGEWKAQALITGLAAIALGTLPVWFTDRQMIVGMYSNRFGLPAMFGASLTLVALLEILVGKPAQRILLIGLLVGLAANLHLRTANDYRWAWARQTRFYWQLSWRAPAIQPGTPIFSEGEIFPYVGLYSTAAGINLLYHDGQPAPSALPYWFYSLGRYFGHQMAEFRAGIPAKTDFRHYSFEGSTRDGLVILYEPEENDCLEVLTPADGSAHLPELTAQAVANANLSRILDAPGAVPVSTEIFGPEPERGWCYLYQKAALAQQLGDWQQVVALGDQAQAQSFHPQASASNTPLEWTPFIEGYARTGQWQTAQELTLAAYEKDARSDARLCDLWSALEKSTPGSTERDRLQAAVRERLGCPH